jgi:biotin carboxyl carrier protein
MKKYSFKINGNAYDVEVSEFDDNIVKLNVNGTEYEVEVDRKVTPPKTPKLVRPTQVTTPLPSLTAPKAVSPSGNKMISPLPGTIIEYHIREGDTVKNGQKLITLEAMKMENILYADKDGIIISINGRKGDTVKEGDTLLVIGA